MASKRKWNPVSYKSAGATRRGHRSGAGVPPAKVPPTVPVGVPGSGVPPLGTLPPRFSLEKIVSGGQTGVDRAALDFAIEYGLPHGGWCPLGRWAEDGPIALDYELKETPDTAYPQRTEWNVRDSDGTVIFTIAQELTGGSALTRDLAAEYGKPCLHLSREKDGNSAVAKLRQFIQRHKIKTLNVAGPRLSTEPAARAFASQALEALCLREEESAHFLTNPSEAVTFSHERGPD